MIKKTTLAFLASVLLGGCAAESYIKNKELMTQGASAVMSTDRGLAFGEKCGGGGLNLGAPADSAFLAVPGWTNDGRFFFVSLPAGKYNIAAVGSVHGAFEGKPPLEFTVKAGKATYIGAIYPSWWRSGDGQEKCRFDWPRAVNVRNYELPTLIGKNLRWDVFVLDQAGRSTQAIQKEYPLVDLSNFETALAK